MTWRVTPKAGPSVQGDVDRAEGDYRCHQGDTRNYAQCWPVSSKVTLGVTAVWIMDVSRATESEIDDEHKPQRPHRDHQRGRHDP